MKIFPLVPFSLLFRDSVFSRGHGVLHVIGNRFIDLEEARAISRAADDIGSGRRAASFAL
jgi:hypothetical protein